MKALSAVAFGALAFWGPDVLVHAAVGSSLAGLGVLVITLAMPVMTLLAFMRLERAPSPGLRRWLTPWLMLLGIWVCGPAFMMLSATFSGGGFFALESSEAWATLGAMILRFVPASFMIATYDGALAALILTTALLPLAPLWRRRVEEKEASVSGSRITTG